MGRQSGSSDYNPNSSSNSSKIRFVTMFLLCSIQAGAARRRSLIQKLNPIIADWIAP
jgi:hypothetical protein